MACHVAAYGLPLLAVDAVSSGFPCSDARVALLRSPCLLLFRPAVPSCAGASMYC
jgi:hypothetical protein